MGFLGKFLGSTAAKTILLQGVAVPIIGTIVGFEVQKGLIKREQKKAMKQQSKAESINGEIVDVEAELRP